MAIYNIDQLVSIKIYSESQDLWHTVSKPTKLLGVNVGKLEVKERFGDTFLMDDFLEKYGHKYFIKDGLVFQKPQAVLSFSNGKERTIRFDTYQEIVKFKDEIKSKLKDKAIEI